MENKQQKINRLAKEMYKYPIFCGNYFYYGFNEKNEAIEELKKLQNKYPKDNWHIPSIKAIESDDTRRKIVNKNFIIRLDGEADIFAETIIIHSAVGYEKANNIGGKKFQSIINKAIKKGGDITRLKINHKLTITLYSR